LDHACKLESSDEADQREQKMTAIGGSRELRRSTDELPPAA